MAASPTLAAPESRLETLFSWTVFPVVLSAAVAAGIALMERGWEPWQVIPPVSVATFTLVLVLERIFPHQQAWLHSTGDLRVDVGFALVDAALLELIRPLILVAGVLAAGWLSRAIGLDLWPTGWPIVAQLLLALVFAELFKYWVHRWEHETDLLWRIHAVHHSVPRLYWLNAARFHPLDIALDTFVGAFPLAMVGCPDGVLALFFLVAAVHGFFQHANLKIRCGPLNWLFSMAELHRWHHSAVSAEANHNYGQNLIVWDIVFGTRWLPEDREPPADVGLEGWPGFPEGLLGQLASPFRWRRLQAERAGDGLAASS
jgi:sterol desaturase/sphingolipid hydroxylase (fatty acid hydroxylase superfamily)